MRTSENHCVIDVSEALYNYKQLAPKLLNQYISFKDYVTILTATPSNPGYDENTLNTILDTIDSKIHNTELIDVILNPDDIEKIEVYNNIFIEEFDDNILKYIDISEHCELDNAYEIKEWLGDNSVIVRY